MTAENEVKKRRRARPGARPESPGAGDSEGPAPVAATDAGRTMHAVGSVEGAAVNLSMSVVGGVRAGSATIAQGLAGGVVAQTVSVRQGFVRSLLAQRVEVGQSFVRSLVANEVHLLPTANVGILLARRVEGDVKVLLDWRGAAILGAVAGLVGGLVRGGRRGRR